MGFKTKLDLAYHILRKTNTMRKMAIVQESKEALQVFDMKSSEVAYE